MKVKAKDEHFCPHCGADLWEVGVVTYSLARQSANFIDDGEICDFDDTVIEEPDHVQGEACGEELEIVQEPIRVQKPEVSSDGNDCFRD
jgi:hypothetical protein